MGPDSPPPPSLGRNLLRGPEGAESCAREQRLGEFGVRGALIGLLGLLKGETFIRPGARKCSGRCCLLTLRLQSNRKDRGTAWPTESGKIPSGSAGTGLGVGWGWSIRIICLSLSLSFESEFLKYLNNEIVVVMITRRSLELRGLQTLNKMPGAR